MFTFTHRDLHKLFRLNYFEVPDDELVFFGLRGCLPVIIEEAMEFAESHEIALAEIDHKYLRCTLGQWRPKKKTFALFPASTVPHISYIQKALPKGGSGTNQLMTGLFRNYRKGRHRYTAPTSHDAFRMDFSLPIRRTADDLDFDLDDRIEYMRPYDNIHAAYCMGLTHPSFASAGCQVIMGYPKTKDPSRHNEHTGPWAVFLKNAYELDQFNFYYALFNGRDAHKVSKYRVDKHMTPRLRYGSHDRSFPLHSEGSEHNLVSVVQEKLKRGGYYSGKIDGDFGPRSFKAVQAFQVDHFGPGADDCIVGPITAKGLQLNWPKGNFDSDDPFE